MKLASWMLFALLVPAAALAAPAAASGQAREKPSLCVAGRASNEQDAVVTTPHGKPDARELDAIADALLNCSPAKMKVLREQAVRPHGKIAQLFDDRLTQSIPAGNG